MALSMTGFGAAEGDLGGRRLRVEIRTVNHRYFNLAARLPSELAAVEGQSAFHSALLLLGQGWDAAV